MNLGLGAIAALALSACVGHAAMESAGKPAGEPLQVSGILVAHWEYPHLIVDNGNHQGAFEVRIEDENWRNKRYVPLRHTHGRTTFYLCLTGDGYLDYETRGQTGRSTFTFTEVTSDSEVKSEADCPHTTR